MLVKRKSLTGSNDLGTVYRPCKPDELLGNEANKKLIINNLNNDKVPHTLLLSGPAGCGKTTAARIIALGLNCKNPGKAVDRVGMEEIELRSEPCLECVSCKAILNHNSIDVVEINVGLDSGKGDVSKVIEDIASAPFNSRFKVLIFDEAHKLTEAAKDLLLKPTEDGFNHVYYIFCTNQPEALKSKKKGGDAFLSRCSKMKFEALSIDEIKKMLNNVSEFEGEEPNPDVISFIARETRGVPRDALVILNDVINEGSWTLDAVKQFTGILLDEEDKNIKQLCQALKNGKYKEAVAVYEKLIKKYTPESIRIPVAGYFVACLKNSRTIRDGKVFSSILDIFTEPIYHTGKPGEYIFYNNMFKVVDIVRLDKAKK